MSLSVLEVLKNAQYNLSKGFMQVQKDMGLNQLENAINQLEENPDANADFIEK